MLLFALQKEFVIFAIDSFDGRLTYEGMIIVVPEGDHSVPPDTTRNPVWSDGVYNYLKKIGLPEI